MTAGQKPLGPAGTPVIHQNGVPTTEFSAWLDYINRLFSPGPLSIANGGTGYAGGTLPTFTATLTPNVGSITTGGSSSLLQIGKAALISLAPQVSAISGGPTSVTVTIPFASLRALVLFGKETNISGDRIVLFWNAGSAVSLAIRDAITNAVRAPALNDVYSFSGFYESA